MLRSGRTYTSSQTNVSFQVTWAVLAPRHTWALPQMEGLHLVLGVSPQKESLGEERLLAMPIPSSWGWFQPRLGVRRRSTAPGSSPFSSGGWTLWALGAAMRGPGLSVTLTLRPRPSATSGAVRLPRQRRRARGAL